MSVFTKKEISNFVFNIIPILSQNSDETFKTTFIDKIYNYCIEETYIDLPLKLNILTNLWLYNSDYFNEEMKNSTLKLFKESIRNTFNNQELVLKDMISISHLFYLMEKFAKEKKENGPLLYKILVFLFIEEYDELPKREFFEENFSNFYLMNQTVPIDILITPYLKHLNNTKNYDICDFNFLAIILGHPRLKPEDAEKIVNFSLNVSLNNLLFGKCSNMLLDIIFSIGILKKDNKIYEKVQKKFSDYIREILSLYIMNIKKNIYDNAILEAPYDIMLESFGNVNANVHDTIVWAVEEYRRIKEKHSNALLGLLWFYSDHDEIILRLEEKYSKEIRIINNKKDYKVNVVEHKKIEVNDLNKSIQDSVTKVLQKIKTLSGAGLDLMPQSVNLSRSDFDSCDIVSEICRRVDNAGIDRRMLTIEITESIIGEDFEFMKKQIERFKNEGFAVWMDDFGSGYSSLDLLQSLQFDLIKFDMRFMQKFGKSPKSKIMLTELLRMANSLGLDTVCEGVETEEQVKFLLEAGCAKLQGYYYQKPIPVEKILEKYAQGIQIGFEPPEQSQYYDIVGRVSLHDISSFSQGEDVSLDKYFDTIPMTVIEVKADGLVRFARSNSSYRVFMQRIFGMSISENPFNYGETTIDEKSSFLIALLKCRYDNDTFLVDEQMGSVTVHSCMRRIAINPNGTYAVSVAVLSVRDNNL